MSWSAAVRYDWCVLSLSRNSIGLALYQEHFRMREVSVGDIRGLIGDVIGNTELADQLDEHSALLGVLPELDSMAVVNLMLGMERLFGFTVDDDEVEVEIFETVGSLLEFAQNKFEQAAG